MIRSIMVAIICLVSTNVFARELVSRKMAKNLCDVIRQNEKKTLPYCENGLFAVVHDGEKEDDYYGPNVIYTVDSDDIPRVRTLCNFDIDDAHLNKGQLEGKQIRVSCSSSELPIED